MQYNPSTSQPSFWYRERGFIGICRRFYWDLPFPIRWLLLLGLPSLSACPESCPPCETSKLRFLVWLYSALRPNWRISMFAYISTPQVGQLKIIAFSPQIKPSIFAKLVVSIRSSSVWIYCLTTANIVARRRSPFSSWTSFTKEFLLLDGMLSQISRVPGSIRCLTKLTRL